MTHDLVLTNSIMDEFITTLKDWKVIFKGYSGKFNYSIA